MKGQKNEKRPEEKKSTGEKAAAFQIQEQKRK